MSINKKTENTLGEIIICVLLGLLFFYIILYVSNNDNNKNNNYKNNNNSSLITENFNNLNSNNTHKISLANKVKMSCPQVDVKPSPLLDYKERGLQGL